MSTDLRHITRRHFFKDVGFGIGSLALTSLMNDRLFAASLAQAEGGGVQKIGTHFAPKAKNVIFLFMAGAPSQLDLFDHKPLLQKYDGQEVPSGVIPEGERFAFVRGTPRLLGSPFAFQQHGQSGNEMSELLPFLQQHADKLAIVRSMKTTQFNHAPAQIFMNTGSQVIGRPSMGSWLSYGLGSDNKDLPAFVVLISGQNNPDGGKSCWGSGFLPTLHQGVEFRAKGEPVLFSRNPEGVTDTARRESLDLIRDLNTVEGSRIGDPETTTRIAAYEMAYRMQSSVPELTDISAESPKTHELYGTEPGQVSFAQQLPARPPARGARRPVRAALSPRVGHARRRHRQRTSSSACRSYACRSIAPSAGC